MSLYDDLVYAGVPIANHESDLYFPVTVQTRSILDRYPTKKANATIFTSQVEGGPWYDVPFAYEPWWDARVSHGFSKLKADRQVGETDPKTEE